MLYEKYKQSRNAAWKILIDLEVKNLPVNIFKIFSDLKIQLFKYSENSSMIEKYELLNLTSTTDGFTVFQDGRYYVFYDEFMPLYRIRFTLAHELGHIVLSHLNKNICITKRNKEPKENDNSIEREANVFASRLLAPGCVLHEIKAFNTDDIMRICGISKQSAKFRLERLKVLEQRNKEFIKIRGKGCFYLNPMEREVKNLFKEFINENKI